MENLDFGSENLPKESKANIPALDDSIATKNEFISKALASTNSFSLNNGKKLFGLEKCPSEASDLLKLLGERNHQKLIELFENGLSVYYYNSLVMRYAIFTADIDLFNILVSRGYDIEKLSGKLFYYSIKKSYVSGTRMLLKFNLDINKIFELTERFVDNYFFINDLIRFDVDINRLHSELTNYIMSHCDLLTCKFLLNYFRQLSDEIFYKACVKNDEACELIKLELEKDDLPESLKKNVLKIIKTMKYFISFCVPNHDTLKQIREFYLIISFHPDNYPKTCKNDFSVECNTFKNDYTSVSFPLIKKCVNTSNYHFYKIIQADDVLLFKVCFYTFIDSKAAYKVPFLLAVVFGSIEIIKYLLSIDSNSKHFLLLSIYYSMKWKQQNIFKYLLRMNGCKLSIRKKRFLDYTALYSNEKTYKIALKHFNLSKNELMTVLKNASDYQNFKLFKYILRHYPSEIDLMIVAISDIAKTLLFYQQYEILKKLLNHTFDVSKELYLESINSLLACSINYKYENQLKFILRFLFNKNLYGDRELLLNELLAKAGSNPYPLVAKFLLCCGADYKYKDDYFLRNVCSNENIMVLDYLINNVIDKNTDGEKLLEYACYFKYDISAEFLLIRGVKGTKALCELYNDHMFSAAEFIIKHGVDKNAALLKACELGYFLACKHLIRAGANIHENDENPLLFAIINGHLTLIKLLVENGASINKNVILTACTSENDRIDILNYLFLNCSKTVFYNTNFISISQKVGNCKISHLLLKLYAHKPFS